ncbi:MAG TPA: hypothetical protein VIG74_07110 [Alphaproteobacteria bacterium]
MTDKNTAPDDDQDEDGAVTVPSFGLKESSDKGGMDFSEFMEGDGGIAVMNNQIDILVNNPLPHLDNGPVRAYAARVKGEPNALLYAMICEPHLVPRSRSAPNYAAIINPVMVKLVSSGPVYWPPARGWRYCFIHVNNLGQPLLARGAPHAVGMRQDHVLNSIIKPMINVLLDLRDSEFVHGNIRAENMFDGNEKNFTKVLLGECLSAPPSYSQSSIYEPIERAMCDPIGRGRGTQTDDLYSFGVALAILLRKKDPLAGLTEDEILREKIAMGSYSALTGKDRFTGGILELLRGLLYDDPLQRWTIDDILVWMEGQRLTPKPSSKKKKAARPLYFNGERYMRPVTLAMDLNKNQAEAVQIIDNGNLDQWIARSLEDGAVRVRVEQAIATTQEFGRGPGYWDRLLSRLSVALDPEAPLRFKNLRVHPEGIAYGLAEAFVVKKDLNAYVDIINQQLVTYWITNQTDIRIDIGTLANKFDSCRAYMRQANMGYGLERCLYYLNPESPCLSERLKKYFVRNPEDLMYAFEDMADDPNRPELFMDRHIAAFISVKDRRDIDSYWTELNADEYHRRVLGNIKVLATIQKRSRMEMFPGITRWIHAILDPVYERIHDRQLRDKLRQSVEKLKESGDIMKIAALFDDPETAQRDFLNFKLAMQEYTDLQQEYRDLEGKMGTPGVFGHEIGREVAAIVSGILSAIVILAFGFIFFLKKGGL